MPHPDIVTIGPSLPRLLKAMFLSSLMMVVGIMGVAFGLVGVGTWTFFACGGAVALSIILFALAAIRQRPRVVITTECFVFEKLFGSETYRWEEIEGRFGVIKIGWNEAVGFNLTTEYKTRTGKKATTMFSGFDAAVVGSSLPCSADELAEMLNERKQRSQP